MIEFLREDARLRILSCNNLCCDGDLALIIKKVLVVLDFGALYIL